MKKGIKIVLGIVSVMMLLCVGFSAGAVFTYVIFNTDTYDEETVLAEEITQSVDTQDIAAETPDWEEIPSEDVPLDDTASDTISLDELMAHFEEIEYPIVWPVLWVVATNIDADGTRDGEPVHVSIQMPLEEQEFYISDMPNSFERTVEEFTNGLVDVRLSIILYNDPITYIDQEYNCLTPESFDDYMQATFLEYNSVLCTARYCEPYDEIVSQDWLGLADVMGDITYGFCQIASNYDLSLFKASEMNPYEAEPWIHEWIHTLEPFCEMLGTVIPCPDSAEAYEYECMNPEGINGFYDYYRDTITASVWDASQGMYTGITPAMWRTMAYYYDQMR